MAPAESHAFESLDFLYMPSRDVPGDLAFYTAVLDGDVAFAIEAFGARVAQYVDPDGLAISVGEERRGG